MEATWDKSSHHSPHSASCSTSPFRTRHIFLILSLCPSKLREGPFPLSFLQAPSKSFDFLWVAGMGEGGILYHQLSIFLQFQKLFSIFTSGFPWRSAHFLRGSILTSICLTSSGSASLLCKPGPISPLVEKYPSPCVFELPSFFLSVLLTFLKISETMCCSSHGGACL